MINFSGIGASGFIGSGLRRLARLVPKNIPLPIVQGPLRGYRWIPGSGVLGYWLGSYEMEQQEVFISFVKSGYVVYDVGAQAGFYTLLASKLAGPEGKVYSFEPLPQNIDNVKRHLELNKAVNVRLLDLAVSDRSGEAGFAVGANAAIGSISEAGEVKVRAETLDNLVEAGEILPPDVIKMDIEGAEFLALSGAKKILEKYAPVILLATHGEEVEKKCLELLAANGYGFTVPSGRADMQGEIIAVPLNN